MSSVSVHEHFGRLLAKHLRGILRVSPAHVDRLYRHYELLSRWNKVINLTGISDLEEVVVRHYCESLFLAKHLRKEWLTVADVGSGAGFPGIPMAVVCPDRKFTLIEANKRKAVFLREATRDVGNAEVLAERAGSINRTFDSIVCRAVGQTQVLKLVPRLSRRIALLLGHADAVALQGVEGIRWSPLVDLPWGERRVLLFGEHVSRET